MKIIELGNEQFSLDEIMNLAKNEAVVLRKPNGEMFALAPVDELAVEVELLKNNAEFMAFLQSLFQEKATISLASLREELDL